MDSAKSNQQLINNPSQPTVNVSPPKTSKSFLWFSLGILVTLIIIGIGYFIYKNQVNTAILPSPVPFAKPISTPDPTADWKIFTHPTYKYQFKYPPSWSAIVNQNASANTLFGLNATSQSGIGGVEIREIPTEPQNFHNLTQSKVINSTQLTINGISGYKMKYSNIVSGTDFVFKNNDGLIYNIYINSDDSNDLAIFNQILSTFKFLDETGGNASPSQEIRAILPTTDWKDVSAETFSLKYPLDLTPQVILTHDDIVFRQVANTENTISISRVGDPISSKPNSLYSGGSRRDWYLKANFDDSHPVPDNIRFVDVKLGQISALEVYVGQEFQAILVANNTNLYMCYNPYNQQVAETIISTITFK